MDVITTGLERKYMLPFVLICIVDESLCFSMTLMIVSVMLHLQLCFGHRQLGKRV